MLATSKVRRRYRVLILENCLSKKARLAWSRLLGCNKTDTLIPLTAHSIWHVFKYRTLSTKCKLKFRVATNLIHHGLSCSSRSGRWRGSMTLVPALAALNDSCRLYLEALTPLGHNHEVPEAAKPAQHEKPCLRKSVCHLNSSSHFMLSTQQFITN